MTTEVADKSSTPPINLEDAIKRAHEYVSAIASYMKATVYALEETEYDPQRRLYIITISMQRPDAPRKTRRMQNSPLAIADMFKSATEEVNYNYIFRQIEVDEASGRVLKMSDAGP